MDTAPTADAPFQVSARKYRPQKLSALYGQDVLVSSLTNGINQKRLPHGFIFTGIRGVGKTTTARIIARSLNCIGPDGAGSETIDPCGQCEPCRSIAAGHHIDVVEMDAATHTGVDDVREIIESAQYKPVSARYKIFIIDEVHMLSKSAFNALLKTLEEPPANVKFIFATTEIETVPLTVLSRCMRFDLRALTVDELMALFQDILIAEKRAFDEEALRLIAQAAKGSARDGLSLLDQAMTLSPGPISLENARHMLGTKDPSQLMDLFQAVVQGKAADAYTAYHALIKEGACPQFIIDELAHFFETLNALLVLGPDKEDVRAWSYPPSLYASIKALAAQLNIPVVHRLWQGTLQALQDMAVAPHPVAGGAMIVTRLCYLSHLPLPQEIVTGQASFSQPAAAQPVAPPPQTQKSPATPPSMPAETAPESIAVQQESPAPSTEEMVPTTQPEASPMPSSEKPRSSIQEIDFFEQFMMALQESRVPLLQAQVAQSVQPITCTEKELVCKLAINAAPDLLRELTAWGEQHGYHISVGEGDVHPTWEDRQEAVRAQKEEKLTKMPVVKKVLEAFPGATIETVDIQEDAA